LEETAFAITLLRWFRENGRPLPWRQTDDPYAIWLSEVILQQTQVSQGTDYWRRFMERWPTVADLAAATEEQVLRQWQGLGYYSRARNLHAAARQIVAAGAFPDTVEGLRALKGVGDYTAAAIASIAFGRPAAVVDGNVYRVLSRYYGIDTPINTTAGKQEFAELAQSLLPVGEPSAYNQAVMDFGAVVCTPQAPRCNDCPLMEGCTSLRQGRVGQRPVKQRRTKVLQRHLSYVYIRCKGMTAIHRRPAGDIWQGLYEPWLTDDVPEEALLLRRNVKHLLTHRQLFADFYLWQPDERPALPDGYQWIDEEDIDQYAVPRLIELLLEELWKQST